MSIPKYDELTWPLLELLKDQKPRSTQAAAASLSERFDLTEEERSARLPSGVQTYILNRTGWAGFHLDRAGLVTRVKRGVWQIKPAGLKLLESPPVKLDRKALIQFGPFQRYMAIRVHPWFPPLPGPAQDLPGASRSVPEFQLCWGKFGSCCARGRADSRERARIPRLTFPPWQTEICA
jgi:hypothetical protein